MIFATEKRINEYKEAVGQKNKYFKWLIFVSTSKERSQAENFGVDILYIIHLTQADINDQYSDLTEISYFPNEKEVHITAWCVFFSLKMSLMILKSIDI